VIDSIEARKPKSRRILTMVDHTGFSSGPTSPGVQETSISAYESLDPERIAAREKKILEYVRTQGGATCCEVETALHLLHQSASAAITKLQRAGHLIDTGKRRPTKTGRQAKVWGAAQ
jgi:hypothetical protein